MTNTAKTVAIDWHNEATAIAVAPVPEAPEAFTSVELSLMAGRTVVDGETVKRPAWRVKAIMGDAEFVAPNAAKAVKDAITAKFGSAKHHDIAAAIAAFKLPEMAEDDSGPGDDWTKFDNAKELEYERDAAQSAALVFFKGEQDMRTGLKELGQHIAAVAASLEKPKAFTAWLRSSRPEGQKELTALEKALFNKNAKSELIFVGKLPQDWFDKQPETSNSAKAYQRNFNNDKNEIADDAAADAWGKKKTLPKAAALQKSFLESLNGQRGWTKGDDGQDVLASDPTSKQCLARAFYENVMTATDDGSVLMFDDADGLAPAKDSDGNYIAPIQFGSGNRPNELVAAFCKSVLAMTPEAKEEAAQAQAEASATKAVQPKTFATYGVSEAAMHLARILSSRDDWAEVLDKVNSLADNAEKTSWNEALSDAQAGVDAEKAEAAKLAAETSADDDA